MPLAQSGGSLLAQVDLDNRSLAVGDGAELSVGLTRWALERDRMTATITTQHLYPLFPRLGRFPAYDVQSASAQRIASSFGTHVQVAFPSALVRPPVRLAHRDARCVVISRNGWWVATCGYFAAPTSRTT